MDDGNLERFKAMLEEAKVDFTIEHDCDDVGVPYETISLEAGTRVFGYMGFGTSFRFCTNSGRLVGVSVAEG